MPRLGTLAFAALVLGACARNEGDEASVDTVMVFTTTPPGAPRDSSSSAAMDSLEAVLGAYYDRRITADSAAKVIVDYLKGGNQPFNAEMDPALMEAVARRLRRQRRRSPDASLRPNRRLELTARVD